MLLPRGDTIQDSAGDRLLSVHWSTHHTPLFETTLVIRGIDSKGTAQRYIADLLRRLQGQHHSLSTLKAHDGVFQGTISVKVLDTRQVEAICQILRRNPAIHEVYRLSELDAGRS